MSFDKLIYEASVSYFIGQCRLVSAYYNSSYHIAPLDFGEGGAIVLLSACLLALRSNTPGIRNGTMRINICRLMLDI